MGRPLDDDTIQEIGCEKCEKPFIARFPKGVEKIACPICGYMSSAAPEYLWIYDLIEDELLLIYGYFYESTGEDFQLDMGTWVYEYELLGASKKNA